MKWTITGWLAILTFAGSGVCGAAQAVAVKPNIVIIFTDDQGYADVGKFGAEGFQTPNLDRMADEGAIFRNFHVAQPVCSASRAALLTGCYPNRIGIHGALAPGTKTGISDHETTLAQLLKRQGYATAMFGKWHLGDAPQFMPLRHGFDEYFGLPVSNDYWPGHPDLITNFPPELVALKRSYPNLPIYDGERIFHPEMTIDDLNHLTTWYTERAVRFIEQHAKHPFFLYVAHSMPHVPLGVSGKFRGKTERGLYGDVIEEIDWSVGQILDAQAQRPRREHLGHFHFRQRPVAVLRNRRRLGQTVARRQSDELGGRHARTVHHALAGPHSQRRRHLGHADDD